MSVDVFGRILIKAKEVHQGPPGAGFNLTSEANFDIENKRLCNVAQAVDSSDAVNLQTLNSIENNLRGEIKQLRKGLRKLRETLKELRDLYPNKELFDLTTREIDSINTNQV